MWTLLLVSLIVAAIVAVIVPLIRPREPWELSDDGAPGPENVLEILAREKEKVLRQLKDLETERESGAMAEKDYDELRAAYLGEAALINRRIEALTDAESVDVAKAESAAGGPPPLPKESVASKENE